MKPTIDWSFPPPRPGWRGELDRFVGPGATREELALQWGVSLAGGLAMLTFAITGPLGWNGWQVVAAMLLAFDLAGGVVTNATAPAKRWYHRKGQGFAQHIRFLTLHGVHLLLVAWLFRVGDWWWAGGWFVFLLMSGGLILNVPLYLQRPVAYTLFAVGMVIHQQAQVFTAGMAWFIPILLFKLLISHLLREEPYRPASEAG